MSSWPAPSSTTNCHWPRPARTPVSGGVGAFIAEQREGEGRCTATLAQFDIEYEVVYRGIDLEQVPPLTLQPRGGTDTGTEIPTCR
ncbi:hypothetical protein [Mycobacterium novum]